MSFYSFYKPFYEDVKRLERLKINLNDSSPVFKPKRKKFKKSQRRCK